MKKIEGKIDFDLKKEIANELQQFPEELLSRTEVYLGNFCDAISNIIDENPKVGFELISNEINYAKYGCKIVEIIKQNKKSVSTIMLEYGELNLKKIFSGIKWKDKNIIVVGNIDLITSVRKFSSNNDIRLHIIPTDPYVTNMFICDDDYDGEINYVPFRTIVYDTDIIYKEVKDEQLANLFIEGVASSISLIEYKYRKMCLGEQIDKVHYGRLKNVVNHIMNIGKFSNPNDVLLFSSIELSEIMAFSDLLRNSAYNKIVKIIGTLDQNASKGDVLFTVYEKLLKIYYTFFNNELSFEYAHPNYIEDIAYLACLLNISEDTLISNLKVPSERRVELYGKIISKVKDVYLSELTPFMMTLDRVKKKYESISKEPLEQKISYQNLKEGVKLASYVAYDQTILSHCRDFGLLACIK